MSVAILEQRARIASDGTLLLHLPDSLRGQEVEVQVRSVLPNDEDELVAAINRPLPALVRRRYDALVDKRKAGTLSEPEYAELQTLTDAVEQDHLDRWECLARLAALRGEDPMESAARFGLLPTV